MIERRKRRVHLFNIIAFHLFIELFLLLVAKIVKADQVEYDLIHSILKDYDPSIRPSVHHNYTLNVTFGLSLTQLIDIDERNMIVTTNCWLTQNWIDPKLQWNLNKFNNIQSVHITAERIWKPDILLVNNADSWAKTSSISTNAIVKHDGNVTWLSTVIFKSSCSINVRYFPFDEQQCDMIFASWTFDGYLLDIDVNSNEGDLTNYIKNGEWHLVRLIATKNLKKYSCCEEPYPEIYYRLVIRRRPLFYVFNMVFPCLLITLVAFLGFYLPPGSTEKVSIGITTLLSITVFLMLVAESMPPTSEQLPLLGIYYAVTIGIVSFSTAMAVVTLNVANNGNKGRSVPRLVKVIFFNYLSRIMCIELTSKAKRREEYKSQFYKQELAQVNHTRKATSTITSPAAINDPFKWMSNHLESPLLSSSSSGNRSFKSNRHIRRNHSNRQRNNNQTDVFIELNDATTTNESPFYMAATGSGKKSNKLILKSVDDDETETILSEPIRRRRNRSSSAGKGESNGIGLGSGESASDFERVLDKQFRPLVDALLNTINTNERRLNDKRTMELIQAEWSDVAMISDHILCYFFCALTLACCFLIFFNSPHALAEW